MTLVSGFVEILNGGEDDADELLLGVAAETVTGDSSSTEVGVYCDPNMTYYNDADGDLASADVGAIYCCTTTGNQIDQSSAETVLDYTTYPFILVGTNPDGDQDHSKGLFKPYQTYLSPGSQK